MFSILFDSQSYEEVAKKVYAGGIPYYSTEDDIRSYFDGCGTITEIDCMKFPETGKFRGIAIITFKVSNMKIVFHI
jgi:nucleolin